MPGIFPHRNRAVLPWIWIREITEHMILWGKECWWKQRRVKIHGKSDKLAKIAQSLCWKSPAGHGFNPVRKKPPMLPKEEFKPPGRKCNHEGQRVHREEGTLRGKPSPASSSLVLHQNQPISAPVPLPVPQALCPSLLWGLGTTVQLWGHQCCGVALWTRPQVTLCTRWHLAAAAKRMQPCRSHCSIKFPAVYVVLGAGLDSAPEMISQTS